MNLSGCIEYRDLLDWSLLELLAIYMIDNVVVLPRLENVAWCSFFVCFCSCLAWHMLRLEPELLTINFMIDTH